MKNTIASMERLTNNLSKLPSVGKKTAQRYAYSIINGDVAFARELAESIMDAKNNIHLCTVCGNFTDKEVCDVCANPNKQPIICVVKEPKDVFAMEKVRDFKGSYHILHGVINPLENKGPNDLNIKSLIGRLSAEKIEEVIIATNPDVEGEATAMYLANLIKPLGVKVSRLAQGVAMGSELEYQDEITLSHALENRVPIS